MSRGRGGRGKGYGGSGLASWSGENECPYCGRDIENWRDACKIRNRWVHKKCAPGADDA